MKKSILFLLSVVLVSASCTRQSPISTDIVNEETADSSLRVNCFITVTPDCCDSVLMLGRELVSASRNDSGRIDYDLYVNIDDPSRLMIYETWTSPKALHKHEQTVHFKRMSPVLNRMATISTDVFPLAPQPSATASAIDSLVRINGVMTVDEGHRDSLMMLIREMVELSRQDTGCIHYEYYEKASVPNQLLLIETWMSREALEEHKATSHFRRLVPQIGRFSNMKAARFMLPQK